jgi:hypothetical protein
MPQTPNTPSSSVTGSPSPESPSPTPTPTLTASPESPTTKSDATKALETKLRFQLADTTKLPIQSITCPVEATVRAGDRFDCQAVSDGQPFPVNVERTNETGQFKWNTKGLLLLSKLEQFIQQRVKQQSGIAVTANCGGKIRLAKPGDKFDCNVTDTKGQSRSAKITVKDDQESVDVTLP